MDASQRELKAHDRRQSTAIVKSQEAARTLIRSEGRGEYDVILDEGEASKRLAGAFEKDDNVLLAYLFGSSASGSSGALSDFDIAILLKENDIQGIGKALFAASEALGVSEDLIDLLDLSRAGLSLKLKVLKRGLKLVDRGFEQCLVKEVSRVHPELELEVEKELRWWLRNPDEIDVKLVKGLLDYLLLTTEQLKSFLEKQGPEGMKGVVAWHATKSMVQDAIQSMIDVCAHFVSSLSLGAVGSYREYVEKLVDKGRMREELGEKVKEAIVLRNRLIHRYLAVSQEELLDWARKLVLEIAPSFRDWALSFLSPPSKG